MSLRSSFIACLLIELYRSTDTRFAWISARLEIFLLTFHGILEWFITNIPALHRKWQIFTTRQPEIQGIVWLESIFLTYRIIWRKRENVFNFYNIFIINSFRGKILKIIFLREIDLKIKFKFCFFFKIWYNTHIRTIFVIWGYVICCTFRDNKKFRKNEWRKNFEWLISALQFNDINSYRGKIQVRSTNDCTLR